MKAPKLIRPYKTIDRYYYNLVPVQLCIYVSRNNLENSLRLFVLLKLCNPSGKLKMENKVLEVLATTLGVSVRTVRNNMRRLKAMGWIRKNGKTQYYILYSYDRIRVQYNWTSRASVEIYKEDVIRLRDKLGAVPYAYLYNDIKRKGKKERSVLFSRGTNHSLLPSFTTKKQKYLPISVNGVEKLFGISRSKASRMKIRAAKTGFLKVKKNFEKTDLSIFYVNLMSQNDEFLRKKIVYRRGNYYLQKPDLIKPMLRLRKRKKLGTYISRYKG